MASGESDPGNSSTAWWLLGENVTVTDRPRTTTFSAQRSYGAISWDDATWIMTCCFIIFTMQLGFALLESGSVSNKNEVNIMVKNAIDVVFGGLSFWICGFGIVFGEKNLSNAFMGIGNMFVDTYDVTKMGDLYILFIFQLSFCTTSTTIVSGAMAERTKLNSYVVYSFLNTFIYCFPAHWMWGEEGFLGQLGAIDIAGASVVHLVGGVSGLVATMLLGPRLVFDDKRQHPMGSPTNAMLGMFILWWGWLAFNCGSTYGISGGKWKLAAKSSVTTVMSAMGGGLIGTIYSYVFRKRKFYINDIIYGVLGALVSITAICAIAYAWEAVVIGMVGGQLAVLTPIFLNWMKIDDPVGVIPVHFVCSVWGMISVGLFVDEDKIQNMTRGRMGIFRGGSPYILLVQLLSVCTIGVWTVTTSYILLKAIDLAMGLRMSEEDERLGADFVEHGLACRLEFPDGNIIRSTDANVIGDAAKLARGMRISKDNFAQKLGLNTLPEHPAELNPDTTRLSENNNNNGGPQRAPAQTSEIEEDDAIDGVAIGNRGMANGVIRTGSNASSASSGQIRKRENVDGGGRGGEGEGEGLGHSNPAFNSEDEYKETVFD